MNNEELREEVERAEQILEELRRRTELKTHQMRPIRDVVIDVLTDLAEQDKAKHEPQSV